MPNSDSSDEGTTWLSIKPIKGPKSLKNICCSAVALYTAHYKSLQDISKELRENLPLDVRIRLLRSIEKESDLPTPGWVANFILLQILSDIPHITLSSACAEGNLLFLDPYECDWITSGIKHISTRNIKTLNLEGICLQSGTLTKILNLTETLQILHVSGDAASEALQYLGRPPGCKVPLQSLSLTSCSVTDLDVIQGLLGVDHDINALGAIILTGNNENNIIVEGLQSLRYLTICSPLLTVSGSMVLVKFLPHLIELQYSSWNSNVSDTLLFLQELPDQCRQYELRTLEVFRVTSTSLEKYISICPNLNNLFIELPDTNLNTMQPLNKLKNLSSLTFRLVPEYLMLSAVEHVGSKLTKLVIEHELYTYEPISWFFIKAIDKYCPYLEHLVIRNGCIEDYSDDVNSNTVFSYLKTLKLVDMIIEPENLQSFLIGNTSLENLELGTNSDGLTDLVVLEVLRKNSFDSLSHIRLSSGLITENSVSCLLNLPKLQKILIDIKGFPSINRTHVKDYFENGDIQCKVEYV
ncbi:unnamed protein product [Meganyctiphanes norvegica]|uniref:Uncharacterized protein n=1 Tax=Meganyctiphanes norvegica TaxID=48144 RepID=A0AAV2RFS9_MEGNR